MLHMLFDGWHIVQSICCVEYGHSSFILAVSYLNIFFILQTFCYLCANIRHVFDWNAMFCFLFCTLCRYVTYVGPFSAWLCNYHHYHHWHNSPFSAKAFFRSFCQLSLFLAAFLQLLSPNFLASFLTPSSHLSFDLPLNDFDLYKDKTFHEPILRSLNSFVDRRISDSPAIASLDFVAIFFFRSRLSALRPTPSNPGGQNGLLPSLGLHRGPVWQGKPYQ